MSREGDNGPIFRPEGFAIEQITYGKGTLLLVVGLAIATAYSFNTDSDAHSPSLTLFRSEYIDVEDCIANNLAAAGLYATCKASDGSSWRIQQSDAKVLASERALAESIPEAIKISQTRDTSLAWVSFDRPFTLTPVDEETCESSCVIAGQRNDGTTEYFVLKDSLAIYQLNNSLSKTGFEPKLAVIIDNNNTSY